MKCPLCVKEGLKSRIYQGMSVTTCMNFPSFYDEAGHYHYHDRNTITTRYNCSNGHNWTEKSCPLPCWCETGDEPPSLFIRKGMKKD